ncbi:hypothetical protein M407DRAFT_11733 [Tulasnella calospora MUT 4182]|uniref:Uncharacterized protein n=1 Tax=Tulasnella calospora MUT 4182 TaxID=1051891 RepID=A0A0C3PV13_9AGAM|nr:hypothetical protein M407DRAFT_11733 [Tulasnella calospora MUT 4182]
MASIKTILARLTKAQKAQLKEMESEARKTGSKAKQRDLLAIILGDPTIAIQPKPGRKPRNSDASPAKRAQQRARKAKKSEKEPHVEEPTEQASQNQNVVQASHKKQTTRIRRPKATIETIPPSGKTTTDSDAEPAEDAENYGIEENTNDYREESDALLELNGMELDHMEFNDGFEERWDEDPANQSIVQLQTAITTVMDSVDEEEEDDDLDLTGGWWPGRDSQLLMERVMDSLVQGPPMKPGSAAALLRWAKQDAKAIEEGASLHLLGDYITTPRWSR